MNGHKRDDSTYGYSGSSNHNFTDFYLCSERKYWVHYLGEDNNTWSEEFTACQPVGKNIYIDGIAVSGGEGNSARVNLNWETPSIKKYDIYDPNGYSGTLGKPMQGFYIFGNEYYRSGYGLSGSSAENEVAKRISYNLSKNNYSFNYENETQIFNNTKIKMTILLLNVSNVNYDGKIILNIGKNKVINSNYMHFVNKNLINLINEMIDSDFKTIRNSFEELFYNNMNHGNIAVNFNWLQNKIEIDVGSKIMKDHYAYRGGVKINIYLNDEDLELLLMVKNLCEAMLSYSGKKIPYSITELLSDFNSFKKAHEIMNFLGIYSNIAEAAILFKIMSDYIN